jgi:outer membrane immunogenic protein
VFGVLLFLPMRETKYFLKQRWTQNRERAPIGQITPSFVPLPARARLAFPPQFRAIGERPLWCAFRTQVGHYSTSESADERHRAPQMQRDRAARWDALKNLQVVG